MAISNGKIRIEGRAGCSTVRVALLVSAVAQPQERPSMNIHLIRALQCVAALLACVSGALAQNVPGARFNPGLVTTGTVNTMVEQPDGRVIIGGVFSSVNGVPRSRVARINRDGSVDETWDPSVSGFVNSIVIIGNDAFIGGEFQSVHGVGRNNLAKVSLTGDGSPDLSWEVNTAGGFGQGRVWILAT
jgi:hypothetical protein